MPRMTRTIISIPEDEKKWLMSYGKRHRISSAEAVRLAIREFRRKTTGADANGGKVMEDRSAYGSPLPSDITDPEEVKRRAIAAAGRFESGLPNLSIEHDHYLADAPAGGGIKSGSAGARAGARSGKGRGAR
jgi:hypothetical protein